MARAVTSLSGAVTEPIEKIDKLLKYFFAADESQSSFAPLGSVKSLPKIAKKFKAGVEMAEAVQTALVDLFRPHFDSAEITVNTTPINNDLAHYTLQVAIKVYQDGKAYDAVEIRTIKDSFIEIYG